MEVSSQPSAQIDQTTSQSPSNSTVPPTSPKPTKTLVIIMGLVISLSVGSAIFLFLQNQSLKSQLGLPGVKLPWTKVTCELNGQIYQPGESVPSGDTCNSCSCDENGQVACTTMACLVGNEQATIDLTSEWVGHVVDNYRFKLPEDFKLNQATESEFHAEFTNQETGIKSIEFILSGGGFGIHCYDAAQSSSTGIKNINGQEMEVNLYQGTTGSTDIDSACYQYDNSDSYIYLIHLNYPNDQLNDILVIEGSTSELDIESAEILVNQILSTFEFNDTESKEIPSDWQSYTDPKYPYTVSFPGSWQSNTLTSNLDSQIIEGEKITAINSSGEGGQVAIYYEGEFDHGYYPWQLESTTESVLDGKKVTKTVLALDSNSNKWIIITSEDPSLPEYFRIEANVVRDNVGLIDQILSTFKFTN